MMNGNDEQDAKGCFYDGYEVKCFLFFGKCLTLQNFKSLTHCCFLRREKYYKFQSMRFVSKEKGEIYRELKWGARENNC